MIIFQADSWAGLTAEELHKIKGNSEDDVLKMVQDLQFVKWMWTPSAKLESYQGDNQVKLTMVDSKVVEWD